MGKDRVIGAGCGVILINDKNQILMGKRSDNPLTADSEMHEEGSWSRVKSLLGNGLIRIKFQLIYFLQVKKLSSVI